jgi:hypothetical protein
MGYPVVLAVRRSAFSSPLWSTAPCGLPLLVVSFLVRGTIFFTVVENWSVLDTFYFSVGTLTTVGLGDPGTSPAPTASELLDATLRAVAGTVLLLLVCAAALAVLFLILWLLGEFLSGLMTNWLRTAWIGLGVFFFVMVVVPGALLIHQNSGIGDWQQANQQQDVGPESVICNKVYLSQAGACIAPEMEMPQ